MVADGELKAVERLRLLSDGGSVDSLAAVMGARGSSGDADHDGAVYDDEAAMVVAQFEENSGGDKTLELELRRRSSSRGTMA